VHASRAHVGGTVDWSGLVVATLVPVLSCASVPLQREPAYSVPAQHIASARPHVARVQCSRTVAEYSYVQRRAQCRVHGARTVPTSRAGPVPALQARVLRHVPPL
jgi:hypothetical protein